MARVRRKNLADRLLTSKLTLVGTARKRPCVFVGSAPLYCISQNKDSAACQATLFTFRRAFTPGEACMSVVRTSEWPPEVKREQVT